MTTTYVGEFFDKNAHVRPIIEGPDFARGYAGQAVAAEPRVSKQKTEVRIKLGGRVGCRILGVIVFEFQKLIEVRFATLLVIIRRLRYGYAFRKIPLSKQKFAIVDPEDYDRLMEFRWHARAGRHTFYAIHSLTNGRKERRKNAHMHHLVVDIPEGCVCDHINHNGLDNRKVNLRAVTLAQNMWNRGKIKKDAATRFKGVDWVKKQKCWRSRITFDGKRITLGTFDTPVAAAKAYDEAAKKYHGEFAVLNFPA